MFFHGQKGNSRFLFQSVDECVSGVKDLPPRKQLCRIKVHINCVQFSGYLYSFEIRPFCNLMLQGMISISVAIDVDLVSEPGSSFTSMQSTSSNSFAFWSVWKLNQRSGHFYLGLIHRDVPPNYL